MKRLNLCVRINLDLFWGELPRVATSLDDEVVHGGGDGHGRQVEVDGDEEETDQDDSDDDEQNDARQVVRQNAGLALLRFRHFKSFLNDHF